MSKSTVVQVISFLSLTVGIVVVTGWVLDMQILKSLHPSWVSMKFVTAISFVLCGAILYFTDKLTAGKETFSQLVLPPAVLTLLLIMTTLLSSSMLGIRTGLEDLFVKDTTYAIKTVIPGRPSLGTMVGFMLIALAGLAAMAKIAKLKISLQVMGGVIGIIGVLGIVGYLINAPLLYYSVPEVSTAMALHTAILFALLGLGFFLAGQRSEL